MEKEYYFSAELKANIVLSDDEFTLLLNSSKQHYDSKVKSISEIGGFLFGINNRRTWAKEDGKKDTEPDYIKYILIKCSFLGRIFFISY